MEGWSAIILAAGLGTRMKSKRPKVLHALCGWPMIAYPVQAALAAGVKRIVVVVSHESDSVESALKNIFPGIPFVFATQSVQRGTADALRCGLEVLTPTDRHALVLYGDTPLITEAPLRVLLNASKDASLAMLTGTLDEPKGYGRILRDAKGHVVGIREDKDCSAAERSINEVNPGLYAASTDFFRQGLGRLSNQNAQGEYYLTDLIALAEGKVQAVAWNMEELRGVNDRFELSQAQATLNQRLLKAHAEGGVTFHDLQTTYVDRGIEFGQDVEVEAGVIILGRCRVGQDTIIGQGSRLKDAQLGDGVVIRPYCVIEQTVIESGAEVGPFARLREGTHLGANAKIGNFVETKKTKMGPGSKANHLSYLGDGDIGRDVNIGAGTIFCNYDGVRKNVTVLEDGCFIGSDSQLVAPVRVGKGAYVASGTTVTKDIPPGALALARANLEIKADYAKRFRKK